MSAKPDVATADNGVSRPINLRAWFVGFLAWMIALAATANAALSRGDESGVALAIWAMSGYAFYLSLCCLFFPAPTTWAVMLVASNELATQLGVQDFRLTRIAVVATVGALATGMANLNEYHIITFLLRYRLLERVRQARAYRAAVDWFRASPFLCLFAVSLIPIPVDAIRWLAITSRYPRGKFFLAYFLGRWIRYALWSVTAIGLALSVWHILGIQGALVLAALARVIPRIVRRARQDSPAISATPNQPIELEARPVE